MTATEVARAGPVEVAWDAVARLAEIRFHEPGQGGNREAEVLTGRLAAWTMDGAPYRLLVDCSSMEDADAGWRTTWAAFYEQHREQVTIAWYGANPRVRLVILMFQKGTRVRGQAFATRDEAVAWLASAASG